MEKKYIIGGLAIVGAIALFAYLKPTSAKRNSEGFFGANGKRKNLSLASNDLSSERQLQCRRPDGSYYLQPAGFTNCVYGNHKEIGYV